MPAPLKHAPRMALLIVFSLLLPASCVADINEDLWAAARKGDAKTVKELLAKGADVNAKFRYGATALSYACDRGHLEVVKALVEHGADLNVRDTFYSATPLGWAASKGHVEVVRYLLQKGADAGKDAALRMGISGGHTDIVEAALKRGGFSPDALTAALAQATKAGRTETVELLKKAGAKEPPRADFQVDAETLKSYAGVYKAADGPEITLQVKDGKLVGGPTGQPPATMGAIDKTTFRPLAIEGITLVFQSEGGNVVGFTFRQGNNTQVFKKAEQKQQ